MIPKYLYKMVTRLLLCTCEGKQIFFFKEKSQICKCRRSKQMPLTNQITEIPPQVRTHFCYISNINDTMVDKQKVYICMLTSCHSMTDKIVYFSLHVRTCI